MYGAPLTVAPVLLALVLIVSGAMKLLDRDTVTDAFVSLRLPSVLTRIKAPAILPWAEIALALALLVSRGGAAVVAAGAACVLFVAYLVVIVRALGFDEPVRCACFGKLGLGTVDGSTAVRNVLLVVLSFITLYDAAQGRSVVERIADFDATDRAWLVAVLAAVMLTWLIAGARGGAPATTRASHEGRRVRDSGERRPIPQATLRSHDDTPVDLRDLARHEPVLLLFVSPTCGSCRAVIARVRTYRQQQERSAVRAVLVLAGPPRSPSGLADVDEADVLFDRRGDLTRQVAVATPAALLLQPGDQMARGPVSGKEAVLALLDEIERPHEIDEGSAHRANGEPSPAATSADAGLGVEDAPDGADPEEYLRRPTPYALFTDGGGSQVSLLEVGRRGPSVLLLVSPSCGSCLEVLDRAPAWQEQLRGIPVHYVVDYPHAVDSLRARGIADERILFDETSAVSTMMGVGTPTLFAVGPDDHLLAGPVSGLGDITATMEAIIAEVATVRPEPA